MGSVGNPNPWAPYDAYRDCSQQICSLYCPQWCSFSFPPPPAFSLGDDSGADFSPLIIAVIGILVSAFILVSYYTIISKFCRQRGRDNSSLEFDENRNEINGDAWQSASAGLDEAFIKSITVCKYRRGDGLVDGTDCSVCLSEFQEDESLRLLPKCNHAFHVPCIDAWLMSHASCPLCRANIAPINSVPNQAPASIQESSRSTNVSALQYPNRNDAVLVIQELETGVRQEAVVGLAWDGVPKTPNQAVHNVENGEGRDHNTIEIRPDGIQPIRRSVSLNSSLCQGRVSIADILRAGEDTDDEFQIEDLQISNGIGSSEQSGEESYKMSSRTGLYSLVRSPLAMKRSVSTGRFLFPRYDRGRNSILPN